MNRTEMLNKMGIGDDDFRDYLKKSSDYLATLNEAQMKFHTNSKPPTATIAQAAASLGPDVTAEDIQQLFAEAPPIEGILFTNYCCGKI
jgi:hypothetical protein